MLAHLESFCMLLLASLLAEFPSAEVAEFCFCKSPLANSLAKSPSDVIYRNPEELGQ